MEKSATEARAVMAFAKIASSPSLKDRIINFPCGLPPSPDEYSCLLTIPKQAFGCGAHGYLPRNGFFVHREAGRLDIMLLDLYFLLCVVILFLNGCKVLLPECNYGSFIRGYEISPPRLFNHSLLLQFPDCFSDSFRAAPSLFCKVYVRRQFCAQRILSTQNTKENLIGKTLIHFFVYFNVPTYATPPYPNVFLISSNSCRFSTQFST